MTDQIELQLVEFIELLGTFSPNIRDHKKQIH